MLALSGKWLEWHGREPIHRGPEPRPVERIGNCAWISFTMILRRGTSATT